MTFPPLTGADAAAFADCLFLVGQAWVRRALGDDRGAVAYLAEAMVMVPDGTVEMILCMIEDRALPEPVPGAMDPWLECCRQAGAGELRLTGARFGPARRLRFLPRRHLQTEAAFCAAVAGQARDVLGRHVSVRYRDRRRSSRRVISAGWMFRAER